MTDGRRPSSEAVGHLARAADEAGEGGRSRAPSCVRREQGICSDRWRRRSGFGRKRGFLRRVRTSHRRRRGIRRRGLTDSPAGGASAVGSGSVAGAREASAVAAGPVRSAGEASAAGSFVLPAASGGAPPWVANRGFSIACGAASGRSICGASDALGACAGRQRRRRLRPRSSGPRLFRARIEPFQALAAIFRRAPFVMPAHAGIQGRRGANDRDVAPGGSGFPFPRG